MLTGIFTFYMGNFYERGQADLSPFFSFHPWLYLFLVPAVSMRLWAEERRSGTIELLMTLPISTASAVIGKFMAACVFTGVALLLTATHCGITRGNVIRLCEENGIPIRQKNFSTTDVYGADEAFVTGTFGGVTPVTKIDGRTIGEGKFGDMSRKLSDLYHELIEAEVAKTKSERG